MTLSEWSENNIDYGRKLVRTGLDGVHSGEEQYLHGQAPGPFLKVSALNSLVPAAVGACIGALSAQPRNGHNPGVKAVAFGVLGCAIGFAAGLVWSTRGLTESIASAAWKNIGKVRDEHWLEKHPIDYA
jgi:hypothetical protein